MSKTTIETIYGRRHKYEIKKTEAGLLSLSPSFRIYRDGEYWKGTYDSLADAVAAAKAAD
jgi:hypothetical protein